MLADFFRILAMPEFEPGLGINMLYILRHFIHLPWFTLFITYWCLIQLYRIPFFFVQLVASVIRHMGSGFHEDFQQRRNSVYFDAPISDTYVCAEFRQLITVMCSSSASKEFRGILVTLPGRSTTVVVNSSRLQLFCGGPAQIVDCQPPLWPASSWYHAGLLLV